MLKLNLHQMLDLMVRKWYELGEDDRVTIFVKIHSDQFEKNPQCYISGNSYSPIQDMNEMIEEIERMKSKTV